MPLYIKIETPTQKRKLGPYPDGELMDVLKKAMTMSTKGAPTTVIQACGRGRPSKLRVYVQGEVAHRFEREGTPLTHEQLRLWLARRVCAIRPK